MSDPNRTQFAMKALNLADHFNAEVGDKRVSGYRVQLARPEGLSTGGGKQAVQHISLVPDGGGDATITAGWANQLEGSAELRTYEQLAQLHASRFRGKKIPLDRISYNELLKRMRAFFGDRGLSVVLVDAAKTPAAPTSSRFTVVMVFLGVALEAAGAMFFLLDQHK
jgi:hypothetical protein